MKYLYVFLCFALLPFQSVIFAADNEIYLDQSGTTLNLDIEQLGSSNIIGGLLSSAGSLTAFDIDGTTMTIDLNMVGNSNISE